MVDMTRGILECQLSLKIENSSSLSSLHQKPNDVCLAATANASEMLSGLSVPAEEMAAPRRVCLAYQIAEGVGFRSFARSGNWVRHGDILRTSNCNLTWS